ncbi:putative pyridine nucleotide-disulfide oxidoreductase-like protein [Diaporthe ampelina]|uniref:Putative pyridine nucleotide-disulfide oxidoreductase-like protein n=1 Tax=Diaporthe ampelina TaxID=1214573 RepID=A0A0G2I0P1_9PEZI|nr:putative pyridine nucleotide-disulfide oxidoreductase-like protein [Diaporthe ampelina]
MPNSNGPDQPEKIDVKALSNKYLEEKERRERADALTQYEELEESEHLSSLADDPFVDHDVLNAQQQALEDGQQVQVIILGAGFGGILFAARLVEAGVKPEDIRLVDVAGGFGGTWYWNRYPGVMCDTEASVYLPLLEETGYMPKHKYSYGEEIRGHCERIATHYGFADKGMFRTAITRAEWNDETRRWSLDMEQNRGPGHEKVRLTAYSQFFCLCNGVLNHPKAPKVPGLESFKGQMFHAARWNYNITGGSPAEQRLTRLRGKKVGILGTGPTAIQAIPKLAEASDELYVFQRTPASVGYRNQQPTDQAEWETQITAKPGWQLERLTNFALLCQGEPADERFMTDGWTKLKTFSAFTGRSDAPVMTKDCVEKHINDYIEQDAPFQERIRERVDKVVRDRRTAEALKPWYHTWCKRPGFHDEYLETFNRPNVHLVDTAGTKGITGASPKGLLMGEREVELDVLVLGTGFRPLVNLLDPDPGAKSNTVIIGMSNPF